MIKARRTSALGVLFRKSHVSVLLRRWSPEPGRDLCPLPPGEGAMEEVPRLLPLPDVGGFLGAGIIACILVGVLEL